MKSKRGVTTAVIVLAVVIMFVILTTATVVGSRNIDTVGYEEYMSQVTRVANGVNEYIVANGDLPTTHQIVAKVNLTEDLVNELTENNDLENDLYVLDMSKIDINNVTKGRGTVDDRDVFLVAENSNNVYYFKGYRYRNTMYYGV